MLEPKQSNRRMWWIAGGIMILLVFGCMSAFMVSTLALRWFVFEPAVVSRTASAPRVVKSLRPRTCHCPARAGSDRHARSGADYETAVLENIYSQVDPSVVNVTVLSSAHSTIPNELRPPDLDPDQLLPFSSGSGFVWDLTATW